MTDPTDARLQAAVRIVGGDDAERVLRPALASTGATLRGSRRRAVHRQGATSVSAVFDCDIDDGDERSRRALCVAHHSLRPVPPGGVDVELEGVTFRVWRHPFDPYLPGLPDATDPEHVGALLRRHGLDVDRASVRTRRYRPTRRAVLEWGREGTSEPLLFAKVMGGRTPELVQRRTEMIVAAHRHLQGALPVPTVVEHDPLAGVVALSRLRGSSLRAALRAGRPLPSTAAVLELAHRLHTLPTIRTGADPGAYSDVSRHVRTLAGLVPDRTADVERAAQVAADVGGPAGLVHGDLHDGQLLVEGDTVVGLLDIDGIGSGLVAQDLGRLVANCEAATLYGGEAAVRAAAFAAALFDGATALAPADDVVRAAAGAWVALATGPHRAQTATWRRDTQRRIDRAVAWADRLG